MRACLSKHMSDSERLLRPGAERLGLLGGVNLCETYRDLLAIRQHPDGVPVRYADDSRIECFCGGRHGNGRREHP